jgi:hypothetical protein
MDHATLTILHGVDHPRQAEFPPEFDWPALRQRIIDLQPQLERIVGRPFLLDDKAQDASFFGDLTIQRPGPKPSEVDTVLAIRFSNFGNLFTTWSYGSEQFPAPVIDSLAQVVSAAGFSYVRTEDLDEQYSGSNPVFSKTTWWARYFDYI